MYRSFIFVDTKPVGIVYYGVGTGPSGTTTYEFESAAGAKTGAESIINNMAYASYLQRVIVLDMDTLTIVSRATQPPKRTLDWTDVPREPRMGF